jgi:type I restriction enzyme S subunit
MPELPGKAVLSASGTVRIRLTNKVALRPLFVVAQMITPQFKGYLERFQAGTNQKYLNLSAIKEIQLIVPSLDLQDRFLAMRQKVKRTQKKGNQAFSESEHFFNSLVQRAFRGDL